MKELRNFERLKTKLTEEKYLDIIKKIIYDIGDLELYDEDYDYTYKPHKYLADEVIQVLRKHTKDFIPYTEFMMLLSEDGYEELKYVLKLKEELKNARTDNE